MERKLHCQLNLKERIRKPIAMRSRINLKNYGKRQFYIPLYTVLLRCNFPTQFPLPICRTWTWLTNLDSFCFKIATISRKSYTGVLSHWFSPKTSILAKFVSLFPQCFSPQLDISYDRFIRTTDPKHEIIVKEFYDRVWKKGDIYRAQYNGYYCVGCEEYKVEYFCDFNLIYFLWTFHLFSIGIHIFVSDTIIFHPFSPLNCYSSNFQQVFHFSIVFFWIYKSGREGLDWIEMPYSSDSVLSKGWGQLFFFLLEISSPNLRTVQIRKRL